jgi:hypothetical protein
MKRILFLLLMLIPCPSFATTWYIRADGGTRYSSAETSGQCNGQYDRSYADTGGTGVNQDCAFNDVRYLWADGSYNATGAFPGWGWVIAGGDKVVVRSCIQYSAPHTPISGSSGSCRIGYSGPNANDYFLGKAGEPQGSGMPAIPSGTLSAHTIIVGNNYEGCLSSCPTGTVKTEVYGGFSVGAIFNVKGSQYVDIAGFEVDDHAACGTTGTQNACKRDYPVDDYGSIGIASNTGTANVAVTDVDIHGLAADGWRGPIGGDVTLTRVYIGYNTSAGIDLDDTSGIGSAGGIFTLDHVTIEWSGCVQQYPIVDTVSALNCFDQSSGGYGDAIGTPNNDGASFVIRQSTIRYNTQDGVDLLHSFGGTILVERSQIYGNEGQSIKLGATSGSVVHSNLIVNNCNVLAAGYDFPGAPAGFNSNLGNTCRAYGDVFALSWGGTGSFEEFDNNTVIAGGATLFDISCSVGDCSNGTKTLRNNVFIGYAVSGYNANQMPGTFCYSDCNNTTNLSNSSMWTARSNNVYYNFRSCPVATFPYEACVDPGLTTILSIAAPLANEAFQYSAFNLPLAAGSTSIGAGTAIPGLTADFAGNSWKSPPSIGAYEFDSSPVSPPTQFSGQIHFSGSIQIH